MPKSALDMYTYLSVSEHARPVLFLIKATHRPPSPPGRLPLQETTPLHPPTPSRDPPSREELEKTPFFAQSTFGRNVESSRLRS